MKIVKLGNTKDFYDHVLKPNFDNFMNSPSTFQTAINMVMSLFHIRDWVFKVDKLQVEQILGVSFSDEYAVWRHVEFVCPKAGFIRDVANASKHVTLDRQSSTSMSHIANAAIVSVGYGEGGYGQGRFSAPSVMMEDGSGHVSLDECAKEVYQFWSDLVGRLT